MEALTCSHCCAPLPPPTGSTSVCRYCGMAHYLAPAARDAPADDDLDDEDDDSEDDETIAMTDGAVVQLLRERVIGEESFYIAPAIPAKKERNVRVLHAAHLPASEPILGLYDGTVFGAADDGFVITARRLCWRNIMDPPQMLAWHHVDPESISIDGTRIHLRRMHIDTIADADGDFLDACEEVFVILARSARQAAAAAPPAPAFPGYAPAAATHQGYGYPPPAAHGYGYGPPVAQPVFGCWHCRTPLHWQTSRCGRCGAMPGPQGWPRLA